jgi:hypothetical protein
MPYPTPYRDVNVVLDRLLADVQTVLADRFAGMYLYGSLSSGDFDPQRSDIDFLVTTTGELPEEIITALDAMHTRIMSSGLKWAKNWKAPTSRTRALRRTIRGPPTRRSAKGDYLAPGSDGSSAAYHPGARCHPADRPRKRDRPVQPDDPARGTRCPGGGGHPCDNPDWLRSDEYQAFAILTMCRALHALQHGDIVSKPAAARWVQQAHGEPWAALIERALVWQHGAAWDGLEQTLAFMRYTLAQAL